MLFGPKTCLLLSSLVAVGLNSLRAEQITTSLTKVADLPISGSGGFATSPQSPRGGILQIGNDLWFTTFAGGENSAGAIVSYNLLTGSFTTQHSFGVPNPSDITQTKYDGVSPYKTTLTLGDDGRVYYATSAGGANYFDSSDAGGGVIGSFDPSTVQTTGVQTIWNGDNDSYQPRGLDFSSPIYVQNSNGTADIYFNTYAGTTPGAVSGPKTIDWGTVQKVTIDSAGNTVATAQMTQFIGDGANGITPNTGRQPQGGMLKVGDKIYFTTASSSDRAESEQKNQDLIVVDSTLQMIDTTNGTVTVLSSNWNPAALGGTGGNGAYSSPIYDGRTQSIYSLALTGLMRFDLLSGTEHLLPNSNDGVTGSNFADPILFGNSIYYIKQGSTVSDAGQITNGGYLFRYDLDSEHIEMLYQLKDFGDIAALQSGTLDIVMEDGKEVIYFLTAGLVRAESPTKVAYQNLGALYRLEVTPVPEPSTYFLVIAVGGVFVLSAMRRRLRKS